MKRDLGLWQYIAEGRGVGWSPMERRLIAVLLGIQEGREFLKSFDDKDLHLWRTKRQSEEPKGHGE